MAFHCVYYLILGWPSVEKTLEMVDKYAEHGVTAFQFDMPSHDPFGEAKPTQDRMAYALQQLDDYDQYMQALRTIRKRHPDIELHLVFYPDVVESIGIQTYIDLCKELNVYAVLIGNDEWRDRMRENGIFTCAFLPYDLPDSAIANAASDNRQIVYLRNKKDGVEPRPGVVTLKERYDYARAHGVRAPIFNVAGIRTKEMLQQAKDAGCAGAFIGTSLMDMWEDEEELWTLLDIFQTVEAQG